MTETRPLRESDHAQATALLGDGRPLRARGAHAHVAEAGPDEGLALWFEPGGGDERGHLGPVLVPEAGGRRALYELVLACARDALGRDVARGWFTVKDAGLKARIERDFGVTAVVVGVEPVSQRPVEWQVEVDVAEQVARLEGVLESFRGRSGA